MATGVYDDEKTDKAGKDKTAADNEKQSDLKNLESAYAQPARKDEDRNTSLKKQESAAGNSTKSKDNDDSFFSKVRKKFNNTSRRKKALIGVGGGGIVGILLAFSALSSTYRIPSLLGGLDDNVNSSRIVRLIVERRAERFIVEWQIRKAAGDLDDVNPKSLKGRAYAVFEIVGLDKKIEKENGIKFAQDANGHVRVYLKGKDMGYAATWAEYKKVRNGNRALKKQSKRMVTHTVPIARLNSSAMIRRWIINKYNVRFAPLKYDDTKTREENMEALRAHQIENGTKGTIGQLRQIFSCVFGGNCDLYERNNQPVDTKTETGSLDGGSPDPDNESARVVIEEVEKAHQSASEAATKAGTDYAAKLVEDLTKGFISAVTAKSAIGMIPIVGQINLLAELDHIGFEANRSDIVTKLPVILKEQAYGSIVATWKGYADNMKLGLMNIAHVNELNAQVAGAGGAAAYAYLYKGVSNKGEPVDPQVGSNEKNPMRWAQEKLYLNGPGRVGHEILNIWYQTITRAINAAEDAGLSILGSILTNLGFMALISQLAESIFGEDWQVKLGAWAAKTVLELYGILIDPLSTSAKLFNIWYVGTDVINNRYCQTNLGCKGLNELTDKGLFDFTLREDKELRLSTLTLQERLFSLDESSSVVNTALRELPATPSATNAVGMVTSQLTALPARMLSIFSGRTFAAETPSQDLAISGVRQFGWSENEVDSAISKELDAEGDTVCPENSDDKTNICQGDKETVETLLCLDDCPQFQDATSGTVEDTGRVTGVGDVKALATQLLALQGSKLQLSADAKKDLEFTRDGKPITACGLNGPLDVALLQLLLKASEKYSIGINNFTSGRAECPRDPGYLHPRGKAMDISSVNNNPVRLGSAPGFEGNHNSPPFPPALAKEFVVYMANSMPAGRGGIGQVTCTAVRGANLPNDVDKFGDTCHHFHIDVRDTNTGT